MSEGPIIGRTYGDSTPWFEPRPRPAGRPNVITILLDDIGFGQLGPFGSDIATPTIDRLAGEGLRFNRFHVTALCSPTRASLLTGRNHHAVGMGFLSDMPTGFPGYTCRIPRTAASLPRILRDAGWSTMAVGKWHLNPRNDRSPSGPFDTWPLGMGFERYYGFLHGDANHWTPTLISDNHYIEPPARPEDGYHLTTDLVDTALRMVIDQQHGAPGKPFYLHFAPGVGHAPHQPPKDWADRYRGAFDDGWEHWRLSTFERQLAMGVVPDGTQLTPRPEWFPGWHTLSVEERRLHARFQEVFAGFVSHFDHELARLVDGLERLGILDDTVIMLMSDNGASAEGGRHGSINEHRFGYGVRDSLEENLENIDQLGGHQTYNHYPWGWAWAGNTPFRMWKRYSWLGGSRTPLIVRAPGFTSDEGSVRSQFCHVVDILPTVLDLCGVEAPDVVDGVAQQRIDGVSLASVLADGAAPEVHTTQYFEMLGSRSIYHEGFKATTDHISTGVFDEVELAEGSRDFDTDHWSLFDLRSDFSESTDISAQHPDLVAELEALWNAEAERNQVFPMSDGLMDRLPALEPPLWPPARVQTYLPGGGAVNDEMVPSLGGGALIRVEVGIPEDGLTEGVLCAIGDWTNGWALVLHDNVPVFHLNCTSTPFEVRASRAVDASTTSVSFRFETDFAGAGEAVLWIDDEEVARVHLPMGVGASGTQIGGGGLRIGHDAGFPVSEAYAPPFVFTGAIDSVSFVAGVDTPAAALERARAAYRRD